MAKDFIVAIELGSSKITGMAGKRTPTAALPFSLPHQKTPPRTYAKV